MAFAKIRRKINDSDLGHKINDSIPGILVEGTARGISDTLNSLGFYAIGYGSIGAAMLSAGNPRRALPLAAVGLVSLMGAEVQPTQEDASTHYLHKSRLYNKTKDSDGKEVMERVPLDEALLTKIGEYSPKMALGLALATSQSRDPYRV